MTDKKTTKTEKQAAEKQPTELIDEKLDSVQGGKGAPATDARIGDAGETLSDTFEVTSKFRTTR